MASYKWLVMTKPIAGRLEEFERWYQDIHIPDLLKLDGFVSAQRYRIPFPVQGAKADDWQVLVIYELETDDIVATLGLVGELMANPDTHVTDAADLTSALAVVAQPA